MIQFEKNVLNLITPLSDFSVIDEMGLLIPFDIIESPNTSHEVYLDNDENQIKNIDDYAECLICIHTDKLDIGKRYYFHSSSKLEYRDADEHLFTLGISKDDKMLAVSFPDPNDQIKGDPLSENEPMIWYDFNYENERVCFQLLDREQKEIYISIAWIWNVRDHFDDYECSVEVFTWVV